MLTRYIPSNEMALNHATSAETRPLGPRETLPALLRLPAELRNTIYALALCNNGAIEVDPATLPQKLALTQTCLQVRMVSSGIFYSMNLFCIHANRLDLPKAVAWFNVLGPRVKLLERVVSLPIQLLEWTQRY